jgi:integrase
LLSWSLRWEDAHVTPARRQYGTGSVYQRASDGRWIGALQAGYTPRGTIRRITVSAATEAEVKRRLRAKQREFDAGNTTTGKGRPTVKTWADTWLDLTQRHLRPATWATNRSTVSKWIVPTIGHKRLDLLTPADIRKVTRTMLDTGLAPTSARRAQAVLEKMLRDARTEGHRIPENILDVQGPAAGESSRGVIPLLDALALLKAASTVPDGSRWLAAFLGLRPAEARGLTWDAVDFTTATIDISWQCKSLPYRTPRDRSSGFRVPDGFVARPLTGALHLVRPKTQSGRRVFPLIDPMAAALTEWRAVSPRFPHGLIWPNPDGSPRTDADDQAGWQTLCDTAGVRHPDGRRYALYEARHLAATLLRPHADDSTLTSLMGHSSILSTQAYLHTDDAQTRAALEGLAARLRLVAPFPKQLPADVEVVEVDLDAEDVQYQGQRLTEARAEQVARDILAGERH